MTRISFSGIDHGDENIYEAGVSDNSSYSFLQGVWRSAKSDIKALFWQLIQSEEGWEREGDCFWNFQTFKIVKYTFLGHIQMKVAKI